MRIILLAIASSLVGASGFADECKSDFDSRKIPPALANLPGFQKIHDEKELDDAKWLLDFSKRCADFMPQFTARITSHQQQIESNIQSYQPPAQKAAEAPTEAPKSQSPTCEDKRECVDEYIYGTHNWYSTPLENLKDNSQVDAMISKSGVKPQSFWPQVIGFSEHCPCQVAKDNLQAHVALAKELAEKWKVKSQAQAVALKSKAAADAAEFKKERAKTFAENEARQQAVAKRLATKECKAAQAKRSYCGNMVYIRAYERVIEHENKVGQQSGYVNKGTLHSATSNKINLEEEAKGHQADYQRATGQTIDRSVCHLVDGTGNNVSASPQLDADVAKSCGSDN